MKNIVIDLDGTLTHEESTVSYQDRQPRIDVVSRLKAYRDRGFKITVLTSRNMRTYNGNIGLINVHTLPDVIDWLRKHDIPFDEVVVGKPWCGEEGFYIDDRAIRPDEFVSMEMDHISSLLGKVRRSK